MVHDHSSQGVKFKVTCRPGLKVKVMARNGIRARRAARSWPAAAMTESNACGRGNAVTPPVIAVGLTSILDRAQFCSFSYIYLSVCY